MINISKNYREIDAEEERQERKKYQKEFKSREDLCITSIPFTRTFLMRDTALIVYNNDIELFTVHGTHWNIQLLQRINTYRNTFRFLNDHEDREPLAYLKKLINFTKEDDG